MKSLLRSLAPTITLVSMLPADLALAAWSSSPFEHVVVCQNPNLSTVVESVTDGQDGAFVVWSDYFVSGSPAYRVLAQRITADGVAQWAANGVPVTGPTPSDQDLPQAVSDQAGGVIVAWRDYVDALGLLRISAQRLDGNGVAQWSDTGVVVTPMHVNPSELAMVSDGAGGALLAWTESQNGGKVDVYAQRLGPNGALLWGDAAKVVCAWDGFQFRPAIAATPDGVSAIVWNDTRGGSFYRYAQSLDASGDTLWDGARQLSALGNDGRAHVVAEDAGGWIAFWNEGPSGGSARAQRLSPTGSLLWAPGGVPPFASDFHVVDDAINDGAGGSIVLARLGLPWNSPRAKAQRMLAGGTRAWGDDGVLLCTDPHDQVPTSIVSDGAGGAICLWRDERDSPSVTTLYGQRLDASGARLWNAAGTAVERNLGGVGSVALVPDGNHGAIASWSTLSAGDDVFAHRLDATGALGGPVGVDPIDAALGFALEPVRPNPSGESAAIIRFHLPAASRARVAIANARGARVRVLEDGDRGPGFHTSFWDGLDDAGRVAPSGVYYVEVIVGSQRLARKLVRLD